MILFKPRKAKRCVLLIALFAAVVALMESKSSTGLLVARRAEVQEEEEATSSSEESHVIDEKPVMHTFYEPNGGCCGMTLEGHVKLVKAWEESWQARGWDTKVLTKEDAMKYPEFESMDQKLSDLLVNQYNRRCFWRWFAMVMIENENGTGGGWMSDYDTFPLGLTPEEGLEIAKQPGFKSYGLHVPNIIHAPSEAWDSVLHAMFKILPEKGGPGNPLVTDMLILLQAEGQFNDESIGITVWKRESGNFMYKLPQNETDPLELNCEAAKMVKVAHLSHHDCQAAYEKYHVYPRLDGLTSSNYLDRRGEAGLALMKDYREQCLEMDESATS